MVQLTGVDITWALTSFVLFKISSTDLAPTCGEKQYLELATGVCMNCAVCSADLFLVHECDTISDSYCSPCPKGEVRDEATWNCEPCSCCTNYSTPQEACLKAGRTLAHSCLPVFGCTDIFTIEPTTSVPQNVFPIILGSVIGSIVGVLLILAVAFIIIKPKLQKWIGRRNREKIPYPTQVAGEEDDPNKKEAGLSASSSDGSSSPMLPDNHV